MKREIFYGIQATGRGHFSRFAVMKGLLESSGDSVYGYASGQSLPSYAEGISQFDPGPTFLVKGNRIAPVASVLHNGLRLPGYYRSFHGLKQLLRDRQFDYAYVDFEPLSARAVMSAKIPFTIFDNQTACLMAHFDKMPGVKYPLSAMRAFVGLYYGPALRRAAQVLSYSLTPAAACLPNQKVIPPCVREAVSGLVASHGDHMLFYSSVGSLPPGLLEFARTHPNQEIRAYIATPPTPGTEIPDNVKIPDRDSLSFLDDFASCKVYITGAGFESIAEAVALRKPLVVAAIQGQWEQALNAALIRQSDIGLTVTNLSAATFEAALRHERPASQEICDWVATGREMLKNAVRGNNGL